MSIIALVGYTHAIKLAGALHSRRRGVLLIALESMGSQWNWSQVMAKIMMDMTQPKQHLDFLGIYVGFGGGVRWKQSQSVRIAAQPRAFQHL